MPHAHRQPAYLRSAELIQIFHINKSKHMKFHHFLIVAGTLFTLPACDRRPPTPEEKAKDKIDDAFDRRPHEKLRDAAEDIGDAAKDVGKDIKKGAKEAGEDIKEAIKNEKN